MKNTQTPKSTNPLLPPIGGTIAEVLARISKDNPRSDALKAFVPPPPKFRRHNKH